MRDKNKTINNEKVYGILTSSLTKVGVLFCTGTHIPHHHAAAQRYNGVREQKYKSISKYQHNKRGPL